MNVSDKPSGEVEAPEQLFQRYHELVFKTAFRVTGSAQDAEDVLQTVFLRVIRQGMAALPADPAPYLHRAGVNAALDILRRRRNFQVVSYEGDDELPPGDGSRHPDREWQRRELQRQLRQELGKLDEKSAEMVVLCYFEGYNHKQIATRMGTSRAVIAVTLHRARQKLQKRLRRSQGGWS